MCGVTGARIASLHHLLAALSRVADKSLAHGRPKIFDSAEREHGVFGYPTEFHLDPANLDPCHAPGSLLILREIPSSNASDTLPRVNFSFLGDISLPFSIEKKNFRVLLEGEKEKKVNWSKSKKAKAFKIIV